MVTQLHQIIIGLEIFKKLGYDRIDSVDADIIRCGGKEGLICIPNGKGMTTTPLSESDEAILYESGWNYDEKTKSFYYNI